MRTFVWATFMARTKPYNNVLKDLHLTGIRTPLIQLGDIADGFGDVHDCVEELLKIPNLIAIKGNHDEWLNAFIRTAWHPKGWMFGGAATALSYLRVIGKEDN